jgi:DNA-binding NarL/FixJ family response regulator
MSQSRQRGDRAALLLDRSQDMVGISMRGTAIMMHADAILEEEWIGLRQDLGLSQLQTEIVRRLFSRKSRHDIARELAIRTRTVRTQTDYVYREFGVSNRVQLVLHVLAALREHWGQEGESPYV